MRAFEDEAGCIACCFQAGEMMQAGDITTYMNHLHRADPLCAEFGLRKDAHRWGVTEEDVGHAYFVFWPAWVRSTLVPYEALQTPITSTNVPGLAEPALVSTRVPFGPQTLGGKPLMVYTRTFSRSFKF